MAHILVIDDEPGIRELLSEILNDEGHSVDLAENAAQARAARTARGHDLILLDIWMPDTDGVSLLREWAVSGQLTAPVIMMSGHATINTAVEAMRMGATSFLEKPITLQKLLGTVQDALAGRSATAAPPSSAPPATAPNPTAAPDAAPPTPNTSAPAPTAPDARYQFFDLTPPLREVRDIFEKAYFTYHLAIAQGSMTRVSEQTGLERTHLYRKLRQLGIELRSPKSERSPERPPAPTQCD